MRGMRHELKFFVGAEGLEKWCYRIDLSQDWHQWWTFVKNVMNILVQ